MFKKKSFVLLIHLFTSILLIISYILSPSLNHLQLILILFWVENVCISFFDQLLNLYQIFLGTSFLFLYGRIFLDFIGLCDFRILNLWENSYLNDYQTYTLLIVCFIFLLSTSWSWVFYVFLSPTLQSKDRKNFEKVAVCKVGNIIQYCFWGIILLLSLKYLITIKLVRENGYLFIYNGGLAAYKFPLLLRVKTLAEVLFPVLLYYKREKKSVLSNSVLFMFVQSFSLLTGQRAPAFTTFILLIWLYSRYYKSIHWVSLTAIIIGSICVIQSVLLWREGKYSSSLLFSFLYSQGISLLVIAGTIRHLPYFTNNIPFFFGGVTNFLQQLIFHNWGDGQNIERIMYGNYLADHLTYKISPEAYLRGNGTGSSIIAELYELSNGDLIIFFLVSFIIILLIFILANYMYKNVFAFVYIYYLLFSFIYSPRGMLLECFKYIFWAFPIIFLCRLVEGPYYTSIKQRNLQILSD